MLTPKILPIECWKNRIKQLDKNNDGKVTTDELPQPELYKRFDLDGNNEITLEEARNA